MFSTLLKRNTFLLDLEEKKLLPLALNFIFSVELSDVHIRCTRVSIVVHKDFELRYATL